ncbi:MAG: hypothetical protein IAE79_28835, partial [Anaerolinea sp.]|nr:hypothetical protein [Anaerolinea sp.]
MNKSNWFRLLVLLLALTFVMAACSSGANNTTAPVEETVVEEQPVVTEPATDTPDTPAQEMADVDFAVMPGGALEQAIKGEFAGTTVTVDGAFEGNDVDGVKFKESVKAFEEATGIKVNYIG